MKITINEFKIKFSEAIDDESVLQFDSNSNFRNIDSWDSFSMMSIISMIDEEFGITIKADEMATINTLQELYTFVLNKQQ